MSDEFRLRICGDLCIYCGDPATSDEHFPPRSYSNYGWILPACKKCNEFAGTEWPTNFVKRAEHVKKKLARKYRKELRTPEWSAMELKELGRGLRSGVKQWAENTKSMKARHAWSAAAYLGRIDRTNSFVQQSAEFDTIEALKNQELEILGSSSNLKTQRLQDLRSYLGRLEMKMTKVDKLKDGHGDSYIQYVLHRAWQAKKKIELEINELVPPTFTL